MKQKRDSGERPKERERERDQGERERPKERERERPKERERERETEVGAKSNGPNGSAAAETLSVLSLTVSIWRVSAQLINH
ncbi:hypothetical protein RUM43_010019 [Polyplax serrata]|uniref:Uncharacterized protein n=1 Tax=Polyplax serrata TaxID=468196 RepID=A0AAN8P6Y7_POLSC